MSIRETVDVAVTKSREFLDTKNGRITVGVVAVLAIVAAVKLFNRQK